MIGGHESIPYPRLVLVFGVLPVAFASFLPEPFGIAVPAAAWGILVGVSWYAGRNLAAFGWLLFLVAAGVLLALEVADDMSTLVAFFSLLICGFGLVIADTYYNGRYERQAAT